MSKIKVKDIVQIVVKIDKTQTTLNGVVDCLNKNGRVAKVKVGSRIVTAFTSQLTKVEK